jgi:hypothetical protein
LVGLLILALLRFRARTKSNSAALPRPTGPFFWRLIGSISWGTIFSLLLLIVLWAGWKQWEFLTDQKRALEIEILRLKPPGKSLGKFAPRIRPQHPPRMGGAYFRGNDERNPNLFNGGFYRTCTFRLELRGPEGQRLEWGDPWPAAATIHLEVHQSPFATDALFDTQVMQRGGLWDADPWIADLHGDERAVHMRPAQDKEGIWEADFPILIDQATADEPLEGAVYYYRTLPAVGRKSQSEVHYLLGYKLVKTNETIGSRSEVWMESLYNVPKIDFPERGKITPAEWFSAIPIPEIVGGNTSDPVLLGIPEQIEHEKQQAGEADEK